MNAGFDAVGSPSSANLGLLKQIQPSDRPAAGLLSHQPIMNCWNAQPYFHALNCCKLLVEVVDTLAQKHFKAALIDVDMRDGLGVAVAVARSIRLMHPSGTLLVALSAVHVQESIFDHCLTKPLDFESLWQILAA